jgi:hypothetical protein
VLSGSGKLAVGNSKEVWSRIDEEEQIMAVDGGSWEKRSRRIFERLREEANGCLLGRMVVQKRKTMMRDSEGRMGRIVVRRVGGMHNFLLGEKNQEVGFW